MSKWLPTAGSARAAGYEKAPLNAKKDTKIASYQSDRGTISTSTIVVPIVEEINTIPVFSLFKWSNLIFNWYNPQIVLGEQRTIKKSDLMPLNDHLKSEEVFKTFKQCWALESLKCSVTDSGYSTTSTTKPRVVLWKVMHSLIFTEFWVAGLCRFLADGLVVLGSIWIKLLVDAVEKRDTEMALTLALIMFVNSMLQVFALQQFIHGSFMSGSRVVTAATSVVFHSTLCLRMHKMNPPKSIGEINNVQSKDANSLRDFVVFFHNLWACPLQIVACVALLIYLLGFAGLVSCVLLAAMIPLERAIGHSARAARKSVLGYSDERMKAINEMIDGIWAVKLTNLCPYIYEKISTLRKDELSAAWQGMLIEIVNKVITRSASLIITLLTFLIYTVMPGATPLTSDRAFAALALIATLGRPMQVLPLCVSMLVDARISGERIESIVREALKYQPDLFLPTPAPDASTVASDELIMAAIEKSEALKQAQLQADSAPPCKVIMRSVTATRAPSNVIVLQDITFDVSQPGLVVLAGGNAAGKTSLLLSILNELTFKAGVAMITPRRGVSVAYSAHDPWIINATAKDNILMASACNRSSGDDDDDDGAIDDEYIARLARGYQGANADLAAKKTLLREAKREQLEYRYHQAVEACALVQDFNEWKDGDHTLIGERGITISGGQRQRISLARALCSDAQVFLLDAPLSGLDVVVGRDVFNRAIIEASRTRLVIMTDCTFKPSVLSQASRVIGVEEGRVVYDGTYEGCVESNALPALTKAANFAERSDSGRGLESEKTPSVGGSGSGAGAGAKAGAVLKLSAASGKKTDDLTDQGRTMNSYLEYFKSCGSLNLVAAFSLTFAAYGLGALGDFQLAYWTDRKISTTEFILVYTGLASIVVAANYGRYFMYAFAGVVGSKKLHDDLLRSVLGATFFPFFSTTPSGRIASRFSVDFDVIDFSIPSGVSNQLDALLGIFTGVGVVMVSSPYYVLVVLPLAWKYLQVQDRYRKISTELKKIDSASKAPLFSHFKEVCHGLETIRAYGIEPRLKREHHQVR